MKYTIFFFFLFQLTLLNAQDTLQESLPGEMYRSFILFDDSTFKFEAKLTLGKGYHQGTYSKSGNEIHFYFDKSLTDDEVKQSNQDDKDSIYFYCDSKSEMYVKSGKKRYNDYKKLSIPYTKDTVLFQAGENVIWLWNHEKGNTYNISLKKPFNQYAMTNIHYVVLQEDWENHYKIKKYDILHAAKVREVAHRMKDRYFVNITKVD